LNIELEAKASIVAPLRLSYLCTMSEQRDISGKIPPQDIDAERSVLGALMIDPIASNDVFGKLQPAHFYRPAHAKIYEVIVSLAEENQPVDEITTASGLESKGELEGIGGRAYLTELTNRLPSAANIEYHAGIVLKHALMRSLISVANSISTAGYEGTTDVADLLDRAESKIFEITSNRDQKSFSPMKDLVKSAITHIEKLFEQKQAITGCPSGFAKFDEMTAGLQPSDLIIVAGRPSMGKTALALNMAQNAALQHKKVVAVFSLEMSKDSLVMRMLCSEGRISGHKLRKGALQQADWSRLADAAGRLADANMFIDDTGALNVLEMRAKCRRLKAERGELDLIVIDYLQLMHGRGGNEGREKEISEISRGLKALARELNCPVIALSQLNRGVESRTDKRPMLSDLRESGAIEQDADLIAFVYRDEYYHPETEDKGVAEVIIGKQRNGSVGTVKLKFFNEFVRFENLALGGDGAS